MICKNAPESKILFFGNQGDYIQGAAPKMAKLVYNSNNYGL
jgi:hypothetical protein